jgi:threonine dehydratase
MCNRPRDGRGRPVLLERAEGQMTGFVERVALAAAALRQIFPETPMQENAHLSQRSGARIFLKREDLSPVRSYKIRGAFNFFRKESQMRFSWRLPTAQSKGTRRVERPEVKA